MRTQSAIALFCGLSLFASAGPFVAGCSAKSSAPYPDVSSFCEAKAQAECQVASTCGIETSICQMQRVNDCTAEGMRAASSGSHSRVYTQANAPACLNALNAAYGNGNTKVAFAKLFGAGSIDDLCERVFSGNAAQNDPCMSSYDCTGENVCSPTAPGAATSVCAPAVSVSPGGFCSDPGSMCATDTYCAMPMTGGYTCTAAKQEGESCASAPCVSSALCAPAAGGGSTCVQRAGVGQACTTNDDCASSAPYCDPYVSGGGTCEVGASFAVQSADCKEFEPGGAVSVGDAGAAD